MTVISYITRMRDEFIFDVLAEPAKNEREEGIAVARIAMHSLNILAVLLYAVCYNMGLMVLYRVEILRHFLEHHRAGFEQNAKKAREERRHTAKNSIRKFLAPVREFLMIFVYIRQARSPIREEDRVPIPTVVRIAGGRLLYMLWRLGITLLNIAVPILAAWVLVSCIGYFTSLSYGLSVEYGGELIGNVENEAQFDEAQRRMRERMSGIEDTEMPEVITPRFTFERMPAESFTDVDVMADRLLKLSGSELFEGFGLYIDGEFRGSFERSSCDWLLTDLDSRLSVSDVPGEPIGFNHKIKVQEGLYPVISKTSQEWIDDLFGSSSSEERSYIVQSGDTPIEIAGKNGIEYADLLRLNPQIETSLRPGDRLVVAGSASYLRVVSVATEREREPVQFTTNRVTDNDQYIGYFKIINEGSNGEREIISSVTYVDGDRVRSEEVGTKIISESVPQVIIVGGKRPSSEQRQENDIIDALNNEMFMWPVDGGYVYMPIWGYRGHTGNDISSIPAGTPIRASASGTVVYSGYTAGGYGRHVIINHGSGIQTLYGHNSANYVKVGDQVLQGQKIAAVGSTGNSTGNHCHFEIIINGQYVDSRKYVGSRSPR